jgi:argonaute-like protein implicated in RNA metabolism and viral defense
MTELKTKQKNFRLDEELEDIIKELKNYYKLDNDSEVLRKSLLDAKKIKDKLYLEVSECEELQFKIQTELREKDKEIKVLYIKIGELQSKLDICEQKMLPKQKESLLSKFKSLFGLSR